MNMVVALSQGAAGASGLIDEAIKTAFSTGVTNIQSDVVAMFTLALPVALALFGLGFAIRKGISFFGSVA